MLDIEVDNDAIAEQVQSGEYYRQARQWYADIHQAPLTQRVYMIVAALISLIAAGLGIWGLLMLLPLASLAPVPVKLEDMGRQGAMIEPLARPREQADSALMRFLLGHYVTQRESYRIDDLAANINGVKLASAPELFAAYRNFMNPQNPGSPLALYQRSSVRNVRILSTRIFGKESPPRATVEYEATVQGAQTVGPTRYSADISFRYTPIQVEQETGAITPMQFQVTAYTAKEKAAPTP